MIKKTKTERQQKVKIQAYTSRQTKVEQNMPGKVLGNSAMLGMFDLQHVLQRIKIDGVPDTDKGFVRLVSDCIVQVASEVQEKMPHAMALVDPLIPWFMNNIVALEKEKEIPLEQFKEVIVCLFGKFECKVCEFDTSGTTDAISNALRWFSMLKGDVLLDSFSNVEQVNDYIERLSQREGLSKLQILALIRDDRYSKKSTFIMEDEPGYTLAMLRGVDVALTSKGQPMNGEEYERLHNITVEGVSGVTPQSSGYRPLIDDNDKDLFREPEIPAVEQGEIDMEKDDTVLFAVPKEHSTKQGWAERMKKQELAFSHFDSRMGPEAYLGFLVGAYTADETRGGTLLSYGAKDTISIANEMAKALYNSFIKNITPEMKMKKKGEIYFALYEQLKAKCQSDPLKKKALVYLDRIMENTLPAILGGKKPVFVDQPMSERTGKDMVDSVFENYYQRLSGCKSAKDKISLIAEVCQTLEQLHLFRDANLRTVYLLMNKLLRDNDLLLTTFDNPNVFDGYSMNELSLLITRGQRRMIPDAQPGGSPDSGPK